MHVDAAIERFQWVALQRVHDLVARQHPPGAVCQHAEQLELVAGQVARRATHSCLARPQVDLEPAEHQHLVGQHLRSRAPQQRLHAGEQFARLERFAQVVVGADLQAHDAVGGLTARCQHQQRQPSRAGLGAQFAREVQAVTVGQHQVEQQCVVMGLFQAVTTGGQRAGGVDFKTAAAQVVADHVGQAHVVVNQQQAAGHGVSFTHGRRSARRPASQRRCRNRGGPPGLRVHVYLVPAGLPISVSASTR